MYRFWNPYLLHTNIHTRKPLTLIWILESRTKKGQVKIKEMEDETEKSEVVEKKALIEIIGEYEKKIQNSKDANAKPNKNPVREPIGTTEEGDMILDHDKKTIQDKPMEEKKPLKKVKIQEIPVKEPPVMDSKNIKDELVESDTIKDKEGKESTTKKEEEEQAEATVETNKEGTRPTGKSVRIMRLLQLYVDKGMLLVHEGVVCTPNIHTSKWYFKKIWFGFGSFMLSVLNI